MKRGNGFTLLSAAILLAISACGGGSDSEPVDEQPVRLSKSNQINPGHAECELGGVENLSGLDNNGNGSLDDNEVDQTTYDCDTPSDLAASSHNWLGLDILKTGINADAPRSYFLHVPESTQSLVIYLAPGVAGEALGDPDLFVKFDGEPTAGEGVDEGANDCISYNGGGYTELCIIDDPQAGDYQILIDASAQVSDATLYATTGLFAHTEACNEEVNIRGQFMTENDAIESCNLLIEAKERFDTLLNANINPAFGSPVPNDLNQVTNFHVFGSLSNHMSWVEHLWNSGNSSGIYFETSPTEWWHSSDVLTFDGIEWTGGLPVKRSLAHEYIHALDGRYNKEGGYRWDMGWWSEGLAEYLGTHYNLPYQRVVHGHSGDPFTLSQIFNRQNSVDVYSWGELAVAFLFEKRPQHVTQMLTYMRAGQWDEFSALMNQIAADEQDNFVTFYQQEIPQQFRESAEAISLNSFTRIEGRGGWLYQIDVPANTDSVTFSTRDGSGNVNLWVGAGQAVHPNLDAAADMVCSSVNEGNAESCTLANPAAGSYFVTIGSDFSGADIIDLKFSVCTGVDCSIDLPAAQETISVAQPYLPHWPEKGQFGECTLEESYGRDTLTYASLFTVTNDSDKSVNLHWINNYDGAAGSSFDALAPGESYTSEWWRIGDRLMLKDAANACIAVAIVNDTSNSFSIDNALVADAATEAPEPVEGTLGSCADLLTPYSRISDSAQVSVTNSSSQTISLHWVDTASGAANTGNDYGPLANGESYAADYWVVGDRMAVYSGGSCVGVIDLSSNNMTFEITDTDF